MDANQSPDHVRDAATRVEQAVDAVAAAQKALHAEALTALLAVEGDDERALVRHLYWNVPSLPVTVLQAVGGSARIRQLAAPGPSLGPCERCGADVAARSRTEATRTSRAVRCEPCDREWRSGLFEPPLPPVPYAAFDDGDEEFDHPR